LTTALNFENTLCSPKALESPSNSSGTLPDGRFVLNLM
jgi:hypothetical protein